VTPNTLAGPALAAVVLVLATWTDAATLSFPSNRLIARRGAGGSDGGCGRHRLLEVMLGLHVWMMRVHIVELLLLLLLLGDRSY